MIAAAIVCATVVSRAASFEWTSEPICAIDSSTLAAGLAAGSTYDASGDYVDAAGWTVNYFLTFTDSEGNTDSLSGVADVYDGMAIMTLESSLVEQATSSYNLDYDLYYTATVTDGQGKQWVLTTDTEHDVFQVKSKGDLSFNSGAPSTWSTAAVPEPTSGLLLLLGVAGLALRRRRA